jgi:serine/threonine protein kinase
MLNKAHHCEKGIKITDFGLCEPIKDVEESLSYLSGTPGYIAPEIFNESMFSAKSDIFSAGCILFQFLTGKHLIKGSSLEEIMQNNAKFCNGNVIE